jgi:hypothetical protein
MYPGAHECRAMAKHSLRPTFVSNWMHIKWYAKVMMMLVLDIGLLLQSFTCSARYVLLVVRIPTKMPRITLMHPSLFRLH